MPCALSDELPAPLGRWVAAEWGSTEDDDFLVDDDFPFVCSPGFLGSSNEQRYQVGPNCEGPCPKGSFCRAGTFHASPCPKGFYCPRGTFTPIGCPEGYVGRQPNLTREEDCSICRQGQACLGGKGGEMPCPRGTVAATAGMSECTMCLAGTYQDEGAQTECKPCTTGHFCLAGATLPQLCKTPLSSGTGSDDCTFCGEGHFRSRDGETCEECIPGAVCAPNTTLATAALLAAKWRLSPHSRVVSDCVSGTAGSSCRGGASAGEQGQGYCIAGHMGPLCQHCDPTSSAASRYFDEEFGKCVDCPDNNPALVFYLTAALGALVLFSLLSHSCHIAPACSAVTRAAWPRLPHATSSVAACLRQILNSAAVALQKPALHVKRLMRKLLKVRLVPKLKALIVFYQAILSLKGTYAVRMPPGYNDAIEAMFPWDYSKLIRRLVPGGETACLYGGFNERLLIVAGAPLIFLFGLVLLAAAMEAVSYFGCHRFESLRQLSLWSRLKMAPAVLFASNFLCPGVSTEIFSAWSCLDFVVNSDTEPPLTQSFMRDDLTVQCTATMTSGEEHDRIKRFATVFVLAWPVFWPVCYFLLLLMCRSAIRTGKHTKLMLATSFLHQEYVANCYLWEPLLLLQRLALTGFVRLLPVTDFERLVIGFAISVVYLLLLLLLRPYRRADLGHLATLAQFVVACGFFAAMSIKGLNDLGTTANVLTELSSTDTLATALLVFVFGVLGVNLLVILLQMASQQELQEIRLIDTGQLPVLSIMPSMRWHMFLSHTWSSAQDQCATIKRQLQLILPSARVFLDVCRTGPNPWLE